MHEPRTQARRRGGWLKWAGHHPGWVLLGGLLLGILAMRGSLHPPEQPRDDEDEEVPLFI
jgi:hypothetical protein